MEANKIFTLHLWLFSKIEKAHALLQPQLKEQQHKCTQMSESGEEEEGGEVETSSADVKLAFTHCCIDKVIATLLYPRPSEDPPQGFNTTSSTLWRLPEDFASSLRLPLLPLMLPLNNTHKDKKEKAVKAWQQCCQ